VTHLGQDSFAGADAKVFSEELHLYYWGGVGWPVA
jgi:hypothetical protein